jgi:hypothetical protein
MLATAGAPGVKRSRVERDHAVGLDVRHDRIAADLRERLSAPVPVV